MLGRHGNEFIKIIENLKPSKHPYEIFSDWLIMAAATLYAWKKDENVEKEYQNIASHYTKEELEKLGQLLALTVEALEEKEQDFLGEVFTFANLANERNAQYFTPYNISLMTAKIIIGESEFPKGRVCKINDPACGAGGMLVAAASVMKERGFNYQQNALFIGQDIDARCARMAYIQLSLLGVPAVIYCMNTLTMQTFWHRETIGYVISGMDFRLRAEKMIDIATNIEKENIDIEPEQITAEIMLPSAHEYVQGELELF